LFIALLDFVRFARVILVLALAGVTGLLAGTFIADSFFAPKSTDQTNITYPGGDGTLLNAYLNVPPAGGPLPGVLLLPDEWGLKPNMLKLANHLAAGGHAVLVPDLYRGSSTDIYHRALLLRLTTPSQQITHDLDAAFAYLSQIPKVNPAKIAIIGLGWSGTLALDYSQHNPEIAATVNLFGGPARSPASPVTPVLSIVAPNRFPPNRSQIAALQNADHNLIVLSRRTRLEYAQVLRPGTDAYETWGLMQAFLDNLFHTPPPCTKSRTLATGHTAICN
jgi:dienelactone hydrolase